MLGVKCHFSDAGSDLASLVSTVYCAFMSNFPNHAMLIESIISVSLNRCQN